MSRSRRGRVLWVAGLFAALLALIAGRAVDLSVLHGPDLARRAADQHRTRITLVPDRGPIVDRHGEQLALSLNVRSLAVRPRQFRGQEARLPELAAALRLPLRTVRPKAESGRPFVWLKRLVPPGDAELVERLGLRGIDVIPEARRVYPHGTLAAHVIGFVNVDSEGMGGLEQRFNRLIRGEPQSLDGYRDAHQRLILKGGAQAGPTQGSRVELTIDAGIQLATERELEAGVVAARAVGGAAVVLDPRTGEVLALANVPTFNPNNPGDVRDRRWFDRVRNRALTDPYEPGSTFKAILAAAALEERVVRPSEMFFCENGRFQFANRIVHDVHPHGWLSFAEVIQYSSNIGATKVGDRLGRERYSRYLHAFGFGARTGIELSGESPGILRPVESWAAIDLATHSYGQGVSVTALQMAAAFGAIANGGTLMRPYVVRRIVGPGGTVLLEHEPVVARRVVSEQTARRTTELLRRVVEEEGGTGTKARLEDFPVAGKTGTAQKVDPQTGAYSAKRIGSFVGFVPADDPRVVILVLIDEPGTSSYGGVVAAPVFRGIATEALTQLGIQPPAPLPGIELAALRPSPRPVPTGAILRAASTQSAVAGIPSFVGLSLREALIKARAGSWEVSVTGSGWVATQDPPAGTPVAADRRIALHLKAEPAAAPP